MATPQLSPSSFVLFLTILLPLQASAQAIETVGSRALGMGGAFVAVANDNSATWWNPSGLAAGPFLDIGLSRSVVDLREGVPAHRTRVSALALGTPPFGLSYYRLRITDAGLAGSTDLPAAGRQNEQAEVHVRSLVGSQLGVTVLQSVLPGVHVGTTLKYLRGTLLTSTIDDRGSARALLDAGEDLEGGHAEGRFDFDIGVMALGGPVQIGAVARNVTEPEFDGQAAANGAHDTMRLPRQFRVGVAVDASKAGGIPLTVAVDADLRRYDAAGFERRVIAVGAEQWLLLHRLAIRGGGRFNRVGEKERAATGGVSVALRSGLYLDAHVVGGGTADERGWGVATRISF